MIKVFCEICGREIKEGERINVVIVSENEIEYKDDHFELTEVCDQCKNKVIEDVCRLMNQYKREKTS